MRGMMLAACALASTVFASLTPAHAQQQPPSQERGVDACLERAGSSLMKMQACKGQFVDPCMDNDAASTTAGAVMCWQAEAALWRAQMERAFIRARDGASPVRAGALATSQERWSAWRDAECEYRALVYEGGSLARVVRAQCVADLTADRAIAFLYAERNADQ